MEPGTVSRKGKSMNRLVREVVCAGVFLLFFVCAGTTAHADPVTLNEMFTMNGADLVAMFDIADFARNASSNLPITFNVTLIRNGMVVGGPIQVTLNENNTTVTSLGGYETSARLTITFPG